MHQLSDYDYELPDELIAHTPAIPARSARLLVYTKEKTQDTKQEHTQIQDKTFAELPNILDSSDILFFNNSYVVKARLALHNITGHRPRTGPEAMLERKNKPLTDFVITKGELLVSEVALHPHDLARYQQLISKQTLSIDTRETDAYQYYLVAIASDKKHFRPGTILTINKHIQLQCIGFIPNGIVIKTIGTTVQELLESYGAMPLPPYIDQNTEKSKTGHQTSLNIDTHYQTVFANEQHKGSVAAPTASLHFDKELLQKISDAGIKDEYVSLYVGLGTFKPVDVENIQDFAIHQEQINIDSNIFATIASYHQQQKTIVAVGTTVTRTLESLVYIRVYIGLYHKNIQARYDIETQAFWNTRSKHITPTQAQQIIQDFHISEDTIRCMTSIFIYPKTNTSKSKNIGHTWTIVQRIITNFHLPKTSLLMLVAAAVGYQDYKHIYQHAIAHRYKFYSFGDGMLINTPLITNRAYEQE